MARVGSIRPAVALVLASLLGGAVLVACGEAAATQTPVYIVVTATPLPPTRTPVPPTRVPATPTVVAATPLPTTTPAPTLFTGVFDDSAWRDAIEHQNDQLIAVHRGIIDDSQAVDMFSTDWRARMTDHAAQLQAIADAALAWKAPPEDATLDATWKDGMRHLAQEANLLKQGIATSDNYALLGAIREGDQAEPKILTVLLALMKR